MRHTYGHGGFTRANLDPHLPGQDTPDDSPAELFRHERALRAYNISVDQVVDWPDHARRAVWQAAGIGFSHFFAFALAERRLNTHQPVLYTLARLHPAWEHGMREMTLRRLDDRTYRRLLKSEKILAQASRRCEEVRAFVS